MHALAVRLAVSQGNYVQFFKLNETDVKMNSWLIDFLVPRERVTALVTMTKASVPSFCLPFQSLQSTWPVPHRTVLTLKFSRLPSYHKSLSLALVKKTLGFDSEHEAHTFLDERRAACYTPDTASQPDALKFIDGTRALPHLLAALEQFKKVDIKGQL